MRTLALLIGVVGFGAGCERVDRGAPDPQAERSSLAVRRAGETSRVSDAPSPSSFGASTAPLASAPEPSLAVLGEALASASYESRMIAVEAIGEARLGELVPWLEKALGDPEHDVRMLAVEALGKLGTPAARAALLSVRDDTTEKLDIRALAAAQLLRRTHP